MPSVDALTFNWYVGGYKVAENVEGRLRTNTADVTLSSGYPSGGYTLDPVNYSLGMKSLIGVQQVGGNTAAQGYTITYDTQAGKLHVFTGGAEVNSPTSLSNLTLRLKFTGAS